MAAAQGLFTLLQGNIAVLSAAIKEKTLANAPLSHCPPKEAPKLKTPIDREIAANVRGIPLARFERPTSRVAGYSKISETPPRNGHGGGKLAAARRPSDAVHGACPRRRRG